MDALNGLAMASPLGRRQKQRWHHARRKLGGIDGRYTKPNAHRKTTQNSTRTLHRGSVGETETHYADASSASCCTGRTTLLPVQRPAKGTVLLQYGLEENLNNEQNEQRAWRRKERGILFLCLTKNSSSGWTRMMKSLFSCTCTPGMVLKGYPLQTAAYAEGRGILASSPGCQAVSLYCQSGRVASVIRGGRLSGHLICS